MHLITVFNGFIISIFTTILVTLILEGGKRLLSKPIVKKKPITPEILGQIVDRFPHVDNLYNSRLVCMLLIGYAGFFRYDELVHLRMSDINFHESGSHVEIRVEKSKTDIYRQGNIVVIARTGTRLCPVCYLEQYLAAVGLTYKSDEFIFRAVSFLKKDNVYRLCKSNKPLTYTRARELLLAALKSVGVDHKEYGLHSLRSGGATAAASNDIPDRLFKAHGR
jgi:integrase